MNEYLENLFQGFLFIVGILESYYINLINVTKIRE